MRKRRRTPHHTPTKSISHETLLGQKGMNMAEAVVLAMEYVWNPIHIESGIDAIIEIRDPSTGETKNKIVQAQVKAVSKFAAENGDAFSFSCERAHIGYWLGGTARVILIVCRPDTGEIYWKDLKSYFSLPENRERCTVRFSKSADRFEASTRTALLGVAKPEGGLALGPLPKRETLSINLFPLAGYPKQILATPTRAKAREDFYAALKAAEKPWLRELIWEGGVLYSFFDPATEGIGDLCEGAAAGFPTSQWADSTDPVLQRHFAELLGKAMERRCYKQGVHFYRETGVFYFTAPIDGTERRITTKSLVNTTAKTVVSKHSSVRQDGVTSIYYKHHAFEGRMRRFAGRWYFDLTPTYHFTEDGRKLHPNSDALMSGIKRMERHPAVLGAFLMWREFLTENSLFNSQYPFLVINPPVQLPIDRGIDDGAWRGAGADDDEETSDPDAEQDDSGGPEEQEEFTWMRN